jgi:beta-glucosidase/6-phospho-beta-glucosidase/beta-galactosidase
MRLPLLVATALLAACGGTPPEDLTFPQGFLFGTATAGFQVEAGCPTVAATECEDRHSDWYHFVTDPALVGDAGLHISGDPISYAPGFYELYPDDLRRAAEELHGNALRLSIEWSRVFPTSTVGVAGQDALRKRADPNALAYYHAVLAAMKQRGLRPLVTINHYSLPDWIHDTVACHQDLSGCTMRGWLDPNIIPEIAKYAGFLGGEFGSEVDLWATLNEPLTAVVLAGYVFPSAQRANPPGVTLHFTEAKTAMSAMIQAHAKMYDALHQSDTVDADGDGKPARVGTVYNLEAVTAQNPDDPQDARGAAHADYLINQAFLDGVALGRLDANLDGNPVLRTDLVGRLDFLGINYYARLIVSGTPTSSFPKLSPLLDFDPLGLQYDYDYPKGIDEVLTFAAQRYGVPLFISETGYEDAQDKGLASSWVVRTLHWVRRAMAGGAHVEGYFYWTLMDNYEWNHGMNVHLGLYGVDAHDPQKTRRARSSVATYGRIAGAGQIPADLAAAYPVD